LFSTSIHNSAAGVVSSGNNQMTVTYLCMPISKQPLNQSFSYCSAGVSKAGDTEKGVLAFVRQQRLLPDEQSPAR